MAVTQVTTRNVVIENVTHLPKSWAKNAANWLVLQPYPTSTQPLYSQRNVVVENVGRITSWKVSSLVVNSIVVSSSDIFVGHDTQGWPVEAFEPPTFYWPWKGNVVVTNSTAVYNVAADRRAKQALFFAEVEFTIQPWRSAVVVLNTFTPYQPARDVQRAKSALYFPDVESYLRPAPYNQLVINGRIQAYTAPAVPPDMSVWTADATNITADTIAFTWDGADFVNGGASGTPTTKTAGGIAYTISQIIRF